MRVPKLTKSRDRKIDAIKRLGLDPENLANAPEITPMFRNAEGGLPKVLEAMRFFNDEEISQFLKKFDSLPSGDRERIPWEAVAIAANINPRNLVGSILVALQAYSVNSVKIIALTSHPKITQKTVEFAELPSGERDRSMLHQALGFLPSPKGPTFIGKAVFGPDRGRDDDDEGGKIVEAKPILFDGDNLEELFPSSERMQEKLIPLRQKLLTENTK